MRKEIFLGIALTLLLSTGAMSAECEKVPAPSATDAVETYTGADVEKLRQIGLPSNIVKVVVILGPVTQADDIEGAVYDVDANDCVVTTHEASDLGVSNVFGMVGIERHTD